MSTQVTCLNSCSCFASLTTNHSVACHIWALVGWKMALYATGQRWNMLLTVPILDWRCMERNTLTFLAPFYLLSFRSPMHSGVHNMSRIQSSRLVCQGTNGFVSPSTFIHYSISKRLPLVGPGIFSVTLNYNRNSTTTISLPSLYTCTPRTKCWPQSRKAFKPMINFRHMNSATGFTVPSYMFNL